MFIDAHLDDDDVDLTDNSKRIKSLDGNRGTKETQYRHTCAKIKPISICFLFVR